MEIETPKPTDPDSLVISYLTLRKIVGFMAISLVPAMILGSFIFDKPLHIQVSVSAYYHTSMRDLLTGIVCGISLFLLSYNGYTRQDAIISKLAGLFALGIAFFPTSLGSNKGDLISTLHYLTSGVFFALLAYMSVFLFTKTSGLVTKEKIKRNRIYRACGIIMAVSVTGIPIDSLPAVHDLIGFINPTIILETIALVSFGISWLTKGEFILKDKIDV